MQSWSFNRTLVVKSHEPTYKKRKVSQPFERVVLIIRDPYNFIVGNNHLSHLDTATEDAYLRENTSRSFKCSLFFIIPINFNTKTGIIWRYYMYMYLTFLLQNANAYWCLFMKYCCYSLLLLFVKANINSIKEFKFLICRKKMLVPIPSE